MENKDFYTEYKLEWFDNNRPQEMTHNRLAKLLKFVRLQNIKTYTISGFNQKKEWRILIKIGK